MTIWVRVRCPAVFLASHFLSDRERPTEPHDTYIFAHAPSHHMQIDLDDDSYYSNDLTLVDCKFDVTRRFRSYASYFYSKDTDVTPFWANVSYLGINFHIVMQTNRSIVYRSGVKTVTFKPR